jgi:hypothetical protein
LYFLFLCQARSDYNSISINLSIHWFVMWHLFNMILRLMFYISLVPSFFDIHVLGDW